MSVCSSRSTRWAESCSALALDWARAACCKSCSAQGHHLSLQSVYMRPSVYLRP